jgi:NADP oxidoreductase coenzyme F420-dependent
MGRDTRERGAAGLNAHPLTLMSQPSPHDPQALFGCSLLPLNIRAELIERTGTGHEGKGLALRWAHAGYPVVIGSRDPERARTTATEIAARVIGASVAGARIVAAAECATIWVLTAPFVAHRATLETRRDRSLFVPRPQRSLLVATEPASLSEVATAPSHRLILCRTARAVQECLCSFPGNSGRLRRLRCFGM